MYPRASGDAPQTEIARRVHKRDDIYNWRMSYEAWQTFNDLRQKGLFYDVTLVSEEGEKFQAHRIVLCSCGHYFRSLFSGRWKSSEQQEITVAGVKSWVMDRIIKFAYTRRIDIASISDAKELLIAGGHFGIEEILKACADYLTSEMTTSNSLDLWLFAKMYYCKELESQVFSFILNNFQVIAQLPELNDSKEIYRLDGEDLIEILESDALSIKSERLPLAVILRWAEYASSIQLNQCLFRLISSVRLGFLNTKLLSAFLENHSKILSACVDTRSLIQHHIFMSNVSKKLADTTNRFSEFQSKQFQDGLLQCRFQPEMCEILRHTYKPRYPREVLLVVGGWSGNAPTASSEAFDPATRKWNDTKAVFPAFLKRTRAYHGVAFLGGHVFVVGGFDGHTTYNSCDRYSLTTGAWKKMCGMHHRRCYVGVSQLEGQIYAIGGSDGDGQLTRLNSAEKFDPNFNVWLRLPDMTERRSDAGVCGMGRRLYVAGGFTGQRCVFSVEYLDLQTHQWCRISPMRIRRSGVTIIAYKNRLVALGGFDGVSSRLNSVEAFDPDTNQWTTLPDMLTGRSNFGACVLRDQLVVMGGFNGSTTCNNVEYFDDEDEDINFTLKTTNSDNPNKLGSQSRRSDHSKEGSNHAQNGRGDHEEDSLDNFNVPQNSSAIGRRYVTPNRDFTSGVWKQLPEMNVSRSALSCCVLKDLPPAFLRSVVTPAELWGSKNDVGDWNASEDLDKLLAVCISKVAGNGAQSEANVRAAKSFRALHQMYTKR